MENDLRQVLDSLPGMIWTMDASGAVTFFNQGFFDYTGEGLAETYAFGWAKLIHPEDLPAVMERWDAIQASGRQGDMQARLRGANGAYRWFLVRICPMPDADGRITQWCGISTDIEDQRRAEEARLPTWWMSPATREAHFRSVADSIPALVTLNSPAGGLILANRACTEYFGKSIEEMNGLGAQRQLFHPDDRARVVALTRQKGAEGNAYDYEGRLRRADGAHRWFQIRAFPLRDGEGKVALWYFLQTDIDDRKRTEALLAAEKQVLEMVAGGQSLRAVLDTLCLSFEAQVEACICNIFLYDAEDKTLALTAGPSLSRDFYSDRVGKPYPANAAPTAQAAVRNEQIITADVTQETRWQAPPGFSMGAPIDIRACWMTPIASAAGKVLGVLSVYRERTGAPDNLEAGLIERFTQIAGIAIERMQSDAALKRSEAFLREAQRLSQTGGFAWHPVPNETTWTDETYRLFEIEPGTPVTPEVSDLRIHPDDLPAVYEKVNQAREDGEDFFVEYRLRMPDGTIKYMHTVFHRSRDADGHVEFVGAIQDVTQRHLAEEAILKVRADLAHVARVASLGTVTASIAHEVNQPLAGIVTNANTSLRMLAARPPNVEGALQTARRTIRDANRAADVIARLRALFSRRNIASEAVDLNEVAQEVVALSWSELQRARAIIRADYGEQLPAVIGDRVQLQQVVLNLLLNAADAMTGIEDRPRLVMIHTQRDGEDQVRLSVRDTGVGFDPAQTDKLFEAFYSTKENGMGIGLSISRTIIERHRGRLWAEANEGPGATFTFALPVPPGAVPASGALH